MISKRYSTGFSSLFKAAVFVLLIISLSSLRSSGTSTGVPTRGAPVTHSRHALQKREAKINTFAGIGFEFETGQIQFWRSDCSFEDTGASKRKPVEGRQGDDWDLTADRLEAGVMTAEYVLDGTKIGIGSGRAAEAGAEVAKDLIAWDPGHNAPDGKNKISIIGGAANCNPWDIALPEEQGSASCVSFARQVTAPMPLEGIFNIMKEATTSTNDNPLLPTSARVRGQRMQLVTKGFFQSSPGGIAQDDATEDILGFFSVVLSYAKSADRASSTQSPKHLISIMPRTSFPTLYDEIKKLIKSGNLWDIVRVLACYKVDGDDVAIDTEFCGGEKAKPEPGTKLDGTKFTLQAEDEDENVIDEDSFTVKEWIESIETPDADGKDRLTAGDEKIFSKSIGGLGAVLEYIFGKDRAVPLWEFRRVGSSSAETMRADIQKADDKVKAYHQTYADALH